ncbi:MAG: isoleucine--tRNA ligase [Candidatus Babeliales bacterium]
MSNDTKKPEKVSFKDTLNLPTTDFPIRANPKVDDLALLERWQAEGLYEKSFTHNEGNEKFIFHDGPPYANGNIHLGSAYNKILKDIACKGQRMAGKQVPVTPGWDCHGLPIELKVTKEYPGLAPEALKKQCRAYAQKWVDIQRQEFKSLGVLFNWQHPYLTMAPTYEAQELRALGEFIAQGYIAKKNKTVPWCASCQTVLASAEIEYHERKDPSIYVKFPLLQPDVAKLFAKHAAMPVSMLIWTTTPWTLPLNRAVLIKPDATYELLEADGQGIIVGAALADKVMALLEKPKKVLAQIPAQALAGLKVAHPFIQNFHVPVILDQSVSLTDGTACVHCAPGCGPEDYETGIRNKLEIFSPISPDGKYQRGIEPNVLEGMPVADGQGWVIKMLQENGNLLAKQSIKHSYPHCWRCRNGLIFRATKQWFLDLSHNNLRQRALDAIEKIEFVPDRTRNFLKATVSGRLEWCISRQRTWGVPIPALLCTTCEYAVISKEFVDRVAQGVEKDGIEYWDTVNLADLGVKDLQCPQCTGLAFKKEKDILDVWFDSGVSHYAVLYKNPALGFPADLYLEGLDQHRGWFQSSLLTSLVLEQKAAMKTIVTHGFTVDQKGHKMSKSLGNVVTPPEIIEKLGTDGLRLWASSIDFGGDAIVSDVLLKNVAEVFRKIRNTLRFLLSNLYDFDIDKDAVTLEDMLMIDRYAMEQLFHVNYRIIKAYHAYDFTAVFHELADYTAKELSSLYLDIIKDRLYVEKSDGFLRRSAQTTCWHILDTLTRAIAPILSFTAEQVSDHYQKNKKESIHLQNFAPLHDVWRAVADAAKIDVPEIPGTNWYPLHGHIDETVKKIEETTFHQERTLQWDVVFELRDALLKAIEAQREKGLIKHPLEVKLTVCLKLSKEYMQALNAFFTDVKKTQTKEQFFQELLVISQFIEQASHEGLEESKELSGLWTKVEHAEGQKCPRCWKWEVTQHPDALCVRCQEIVG